ncbi:response regulator [Sulfurimonas sp.]|uniref:response regulator n=1 Tax=Sulfurimonas sp. TaxID=2022749 RepID=UPI003567E76F
MLSTSKESGVVWYKSLGFSILFWFLLLSLVPLLIISYESNAISVKGFKEAAFEDLKYSAELEKKFIDNWFYYRKIDVSSWSQTKANIEFLNLITAKYKNSSKSLKEFINSSQYAETRSNHEADLRNLVKEYDYIYDLFLIDSNGNILYTITQEDDLGTNLLNGDYSSTKFASSFTTTLKDGKIHFSDLELYKPSNNVVTGFLTAPMLDNSGKQIGVLAVQIKAERISSLFNDGRDKTINYLLSKDGLLISDTFTKTFKSQVERSVLSKWYETHENYKHKTNQEELVSYKNPFSNTVIGIPNDIDVLGVKWILFSEISEDSVYTIAKKVSYKAFILFLITTLVVVIVSFLISRRIVKPIKSLSDASIKLSRGERNVNLNINSSSEIGQLKSAFHIMIDSLKKNEEQLTKQTLEAKKALQELDEQKFALDAHSIVAITDVKGTITFVNEKFIEISGYPREELIGKNHRLLNSGLHGMEFWNNMYKTVSSGKIWHDEVCNIAKDGHFYWVDTTIVPFMNENNKPKSYIAIRTDITDKKSAELELIEANEIAEESVKAKSEFLATMSHEIRTPMNGVIGMLGLLMNTKLDDIQKHQASLAQKSAKSLLSLINDILDFSKAEAGKMELEYIDFNLREELGDFSEYIAVRAQEKGVELILDTTNIEVDIINSDPGRIHQILSNIVGNSIKFTSDGYILIKASLNTENDENIRLVLEMSDSGIGIPEDKLDNLFDSFSQVDASTTRKYGGTGLGLAIVKKLCDLMDGSVHVKSKYGHGSTFTVDISVKLSEHTSSVKPPQYAEAKKVLIVDLCKLNIDVLENQLHHWGMEVFRARDEKEALEIVENESLDIVFIDMSMDKLGELIRNNPENKNVKLIMMTLFEHREDIQKPTHACFDAFFPKPMTTKNMFEALSLLSGNKLIHSSKSENVEKEVSFFDKNTNLLLVEDNQTNQIVAKGILNILGLKADVANNGLEALEILNNASKKYEIILMDCQMPELDGYDTTRAIRESKAGEEYLDIPIIAMTANAMHGDREKCEIAGMDDYITKPLDPELLSSILQKWLIKVEKNTESEVIIWDENSALKRLGGSSELLKKVLTIFVQDIQNSITSLKEAIDAKDADKIKLHAHSIKGSSGNINAKSLEEKARELEDGSSTLKNQELRDKFEDMNDIVTELLVILDKYIKDNNSEVIEYKVSKLEIIDIMKNLKEELEKGSYIETTDMNIFNAAIDESIDFKLKKLKKEIDSFLMHEALITIEDICKEYSL